MTEEKKVVPQQPAPPGPGGDGCNETLGDITEEEMTGVEELKIEGLKGEATSDGTELRMRRKKEWFEPIFTKPVKLTLVPQGDGIQPARLPVLEAMVYVLGWCATVAYCFFSLWKISTEKGERLHKEMLGHGWGIGRYQDISNYEWTFWTRWFMKTWPLIVVHIAISQILRLWNNQHRKYVFLCYHAAAVMLLLGPKCFGFVLASCVLSWLAGWSGSVVLSWGVSIGLLTFLNYDPYTADNDYAFHPLKRLASFDEDLFYVLVLSIAWINLRNTSFTLDWISAKKQRAQDAANNVTPGPKDAGDEESCDVTSTPDSENIPTIKEPHDDKTANAVEKKSADPESSETPGKPDVKAAGKLEVKAEVEKVPQKDELAAAEEGNKEGVKEEEGEKESGDGAEDQAAGKDDEEPVEEPPVEIIVQYSLLDLFSYCFYLPYFFTGPMTTYDEFYKQLHRPLRRRTWEEIKDLFYRTLRVAFWALFMDYSLHHLYHSALMQHPRLLWHVPLWALAGIGYVSGQFFMVKYVVLYGLPGLVGRFDHFEPPETPRCIAYIYKYSEMWKYFDRGLYNFLKRHIYIPMGGSHKGVWRQLLASFVCFAHIFWWHGGEFHLLVWTVANFLGVCMETGGRAFSRFPRVVRWEALWLTPGMSRRARAWFGVPLFAMSGLAILTFFGGTDVGFIFMYRLLYEGAPISVVTIILAFYCACQTSMEVERLKKIWAQQKILNAKNAILEAEQEARDDAARETAMREREEWLQLLEKEQGIRDEEGKLIEGEEEKLKTE